MKKSYDVNAAVRNAIACAKGKYNLGLLINSNDEDADVKLSSTTNNGDPETVYSIISLYSDDSNNDGTWYDQIEEALYKIYPEHFN